MSISGSINFSGLGSGTDFTSIIKQLKEVESIPMKRMEAWKSDWNKRYEAFGEIIATVREAKENLSKLNNPQKFLAKVASSSKEDIVGAKANADAVDGTHKVEVKQLASNAIWSLNGNFDNKFTKVNNTGTAQDFSYTYKGKTRTLSVPNGTTLESFVSLVNQDRSNPGVKMNMVQTSKGYTIQIQGKESGANADLTVHPSNILGLSGGNTKWEGNSIVDPNKTLASYGADVKAHDYKLTVNGSPPTVLNVSAQGDETNTELMAKFNAAANAAGLADIASIDSNDKLKLSGVVSMDTTVTGSAVKTTTGTASTKFGVTNGGSDGLKTRLDSTLSATDKITYDLTLSNGTTKTIELAGTATQQDFINAVNRAGGGASAKLVGDASTGTYEIALSGVQSAQRTDAAAAPGVIMDGAGALDPTAWAIAGGKKDDPIQSGVIPKTVNYDILLSDNTHMTFTMGTSIEDPPGSGTMRPTTMKDLVAKINAEGAGKSPPVTAQFEAVDPADASKGQKLKMTNVFTATGTGLSGQGQVTESDLWSIQKSQDAIFRIDNWPQDLTSSKNEVTGVLDGVTLTLKDEGISQVSIAADRESVKNNIQTVLDAINTVVKKVQDLSKFDSDKETAPINSSDDKISYGSMFNSQKGSVLTGNYGVQLFTSRLKSAMSGSPAGFEKAQKVPGQDIFTGDFVAALAEMGIKTCTEEGNPNYGLFAIAPTGSTDTMQALDQQRFDDAIANRLDDVISFFASDDVGSSSSPSFRYANHIQGMTKAGSYKVSYEVDAAGVVKDVMINGVKANESDLEPGTFTLGSNGGNASGMSIHIDDLTPGTYNGTVSIKQGKVRQMEEFFGGEIVFHKPTSKDPTIGSKNGGLMILQDNYREIMTNIDKKIEREQTRLANWEKTQRLAFSRLETLLGQYDGKNKTLSSQLGQLKSS